MEDPGQNAWLTFRAGDHREHHPLKSRAAKRYFAGLYFRKVDRAPPGQALQDAIQTLEAKAIFEGAQHTPFVRIAADADSTYLDLVNELWEVVQLKASGWKVIPADEAPVRFRRSKAMSSLPKPTHGGDITALRSLLNLGDDDAWVLTCAYLLGCFQPKGPYPVLGLSGEQGSGKSTAARLLRDCIDPNISPLRALPKSERDLLVAATHSWLLAFDNLSGLADWMSDALCRLSTGGGLSTRELYSDGVEFLLDATRPTILNGIADIILRNDLADRAIVLHLPTITEKARLSEREIDAQFAANHAGILGALLSAVAYGMKALPDT